MGWIHPFVSCSACVILACAGMGAVSGVGWKAVLQSYAAGGAGSWLSSLTGPTVISFAFQLFRFRVQLLERLFQILGTATIGAMFNMLSVAAASRALGLSPVLRLALLSRSTTTALAPEMCAMLGVEPALGMLAAFLTGLVAIPLGKPLLARLRIEDPATRGLALSATAHGGAVITLSNERDSFPFAALMMSLGAACTIALISIAPA